MADKQLTIIQAWEESILNDYLNYMDAKGVTASGGSRANSKVVMRENGGSVEVPAHHYWLWNGRKPNQKQDIESLRKWVGWAGSTIMSQWAKDKGLPSGVSYAVAWKVAREGYPTKLNVSDVITDEKKQQLIKELGNMYVTDIKTQITQLWHQ